MTTEKIEFVHGGKTYTITTDHAASSYGMPVLLVDGILADVEISYDRQRLEYRTALDVAADQAGVHDGPMTRQDLAALAEEMAGETHAQIIAEFQQRGRKLAAAEMGASRSETKSAAVRENGKLGGRPRGSLSRGFRKCSEWRGNFPALVYLTVEGEVEIAFSDSNAGKPWDHATTIRLALSLDDLPDSVGQLGRWIKAKTE